MTISATDMAATMMREETPRPGTIFADAARSLMDRLDGGKPIIDTLKTGVALLDETTGGLVRGEFAVLVAAPGVGKSTIADAMILGVLLANPDTTALVLNLETDMMVRLARLICGRAVKVSEQNAITGYVPLGPMLRGKLEPKAKERAKATTADLVGLMGERLRFVDDVYNADEIAELIGAERPDVVLVDHMGLVGMPGVGSLVERTDGALDIINAAIKRADAAGVLINELSKVALTSGDTNISSVRGSARFASLAGQLLTIRRAGDDDECTQLEIDLLKNRHGDKPRRECATLHGRLGYVAWSGEVEPIPLKPARKGDGSG